MSWATCCAGGVAARAPRHPRCRHPTGPAGSRRRFPTPTVPRGRHPATALAGASPSTPGAPQNATAVPPKWGSGVRPQWCHNSGPRVLAYLNVPWGTFWAPWIWVIWGAAPPAPKFLTPTGMGHPVPGSPPPRGGHPDSDIRDSRPRASLPAVPDPYPALPGGQEKTPRWHRGNQTGAPPPNTGAGICGYRSSSPKATAGHPNPLRAPGLRRRSHVTGTAATLLGHPGR